ncbi:MAG: glycine cleavage system H protein [Flavobacterium sp.]
MKQNQVFGTVEAVKTVSDLFLPVDDEVLELNPELVNTNPNAKAWIVKLKIETNINVEGLLKADFCALLIGS